MYLLLCLLIVLSHCVLWGSDLDLINTLRPRQNGRHFPDDNFKWIFLNENDWIPIKITLKFVPKGPVDNIPALVQIMAWRRPGDKPLSEPMMVSLTTHVCVARPQWVKQVVGFLLHGILLNHSVVLLIAIMFTLMFMHFLLSLSAGVALTVDKN